MTHRKPQDAQNDLSRREYRAAAPLDRSATQPEDHEGPRARPRVVARLPEVDLADLDRSAQTAPAATDERPRNRRSILILTGGSAMLLVAAMIALPFGKQRLFNLRGPHWEDNSPAPAAPMAPRWNSGGDSSGGSQASKAPTTVPVTASISSSSGASLPGTAPSASTPSGSSAIPNSSANPAAPSITLPDPTQGAPSWSLPSSAPIPSIPGPPGPPQSSATGNGNRNAVVAASATLPQYSPYPTTPYADGFEQMSSGPGYAGSSDRPQAASRTSFSSAPTVEPGVARLDGTIEKQAQRPAHDLARPSLY